MHPNVQPSSRPGQMTAILRSVMPRTGPKVLRIALVQRGQVIEERIIPRGAPVTIGPSERSTFVLAAPGLTASRAILAYRADAYLVEVVPGMSGRIALATGVVDLASQSEATRLDDGAPRREDEDARMHVESGQRRRAPRLCRPATGALPG